MEEAIQIFELDINEIKLLDPKQLKKIYMKKVIILHPDKGGNHEDFIKLQNAYECLQSGIEQHKSSDFDKLCELFVNFMACQEHEKKCELHQNMIQLFNNISNDWYNKLDSQYKAIFMMIQEQFSKFTHKMNKIKMFNIFVSFDEVYKDNLYKLYFNDQLFLVPLWYKECFFDCGDIEIQIKIFVDLPENVNIDNNNNIHIYSKLKLLDIINKEQLDFYINENKFTLNRSNLYLKHTQTHELNNSGICHISQEMSDDKILKTSVFIHINLEF
tara:strand:+ start:3744 stop:4559 length:816 start_codon:yes stop_codon:yes gene_type:complete